MYRLMRDDGAELRISGNVWEAALELAYLHGWRPAGTEAPRTASWGRIPSAAPPWDGQDYFSYESQHVRRDDARAMGDAVHRALLHVSDDESSLVDAGGSMRVHAAAEPARSSANPDGPHLVKKTVMRRFAAFADCGGFTIGRAV